MKMKAFLNWRPVGIYEADTKDGIFQALAEDNGYQNFAVMKQAVNGQMDLVEITKGKIFNARNHITVTMGDVCDVCDGCGMPLTDGAEDSTGLCPDCLGSQMCEV